jgi:hypothetical protein
MGKNFGLNDSIQGTRIYLTFEKMNGPNVVNTGGRHNAQSATIEGNPAFAIIMRTLHWAGDIHAEKCPKCDERLPSDQRIGYCPYCGIKSDKVSQTPAVTDKTMK